MAKSAYKYIKKNVRENIREKLPKWRRQEAVVKLDKPTDLDKARRLGYKAKKGIVVVRARVKRGGRKRPKRKAGRRTKNKTVRKTLKKNYRWVSEIRAKKKFPNLVVLNSYQIAKGRDNYFYEVILLDPDKPEIQNDSDLNWVCKKENKNRVERGKTAAGKKSRGLRSRHPTNKSRPSVRSGKRRGK